MGALFMRGRVARDGSAQMVNFCLKWHATLPVISVELGIDNVSSMEGITIF